MSQVFSLKDQLFNAEKVRYLAGLFVGADPGFDSAGFQARVMAQLPTLELKQRITWIADCLGQQLPGPLDRTAPILRAALPPALDPTLGDNDFGDFIFAPLGELVAQQGLKVHPDLSLDLIAEITQRFSMEWAIRPFLNRYPGQVLARMQDWVDHPSYHVRRLVSEGTRPRLPWGQAVALDLTDALPLLQRLHADPTRYVTRSVANHLNDITKKDPDLAMDQLADWQGQGRQDPDEMAWMTRHALRGLVKAGHPRAMAMLGFDHDAAVDVVEFAVPDQVAINGTLRISAVLRAAQATGALVDYVLWRRRANGTQSAKVFKWKQVQLAPGKPLHLDKAHRLKGNATTFTLFPGPHRIELQVNGRVLAEVGFELLSPVG